MGWLTSTWTAVWPNLLASIIWATPAFTVHHILIRRHLDRRHAELQASLTAASRTDDPCGPRAGRQAGASTIRSTAREGHPRRGKKSPCPEK